MVEETKIARTIARGTLLLSWGKIISYVVGAIGTILVVRLLTPPEYGLITVALVIPGILGLFRGWGVGGAMTKYVSMHRARGEDEKIGDIVCTTAFYEILTGTALAVVGYFTSSYIALNIFNKPDVVPLARIASMLVFTSSFSVIALGIFQGFERMEYFSLIMVCERAFQTIFLSLFVVVGLGAFGGIVGFVVASLSTSLISIFILLKFFHSIPGEWRIRFPKMDVFKQMMRYGTSPHLYQTP